MGGTSLLRASESEALAPVYAEAEGFLRAALNAISAHIAILDDEGQILEVNAAWKQFATENDFRAADYGIGMNYLTVCERATSPEAEQVADGIRDVIAQRRDEFYLEYPCHSPGQQRWFVVRITRFNWYNFTRLIVAHQNVTELKLVQNQLQSSNLRLEAILNNVVNGILTLDVEGHILTINQAVSKIFGYAAEDVIGQPVTLLLAETAQDDDAAPIIESISAIADGYETEGRRADGSTFPIYIAISRTVLDRQTIYTGVVQDMTSRRQLERERLENERLEVALDKERELRQIKNRFISMMSHELKTPLASIRLAGDFLKRYSDRATPEEKAEAIATIEHQVDYLGEIVDDVTALSKTDAIAEELQFELYDLETYLRDILEELEWVHRGTHRLLYSGLDRRVEVEFDRKLLRRAITNLLSNAIKYSPEGGEVHLSLAVEDSVAIIKVADSGIGIPPADLPRLFETFHRAENVGNLPGTGLGLAIARQAVDLHRGTIAVESALGAGTTFTVTLPLQQQERS